MSTASGRFISFEGVEGAGKSSQLQALADYLDGQGIDVLVTREPGGTDLAEAIRSILVDGEDMPAMSELLLMFAARASHFTDKIKPALAAGRWVVCDRFVDASYAYQGAGRGIDQAHIQSLQRMTLGDFQPDKVFIFDLPVEVGLQRVEKRGEKNRFDSSGLSFMQAVRDCYLDRAAKQPDRYTVINAELDPNTVRDQIAKATSLLLQGIE